MTRGQEKHEVASAASSPMGKAQSIYEGNCALFGVHVVARRTMGIVIDPEIEATVGSSRFTFQATIQEPHTSDTQERPNRSEDLITPLIPYQGREYYIEVKFQIHAD